MDTILAFQRATKAAGLMVPMDSAFFNFIHRRALPADEEDVTLHFELLYSHWQRVSEPAYFPEASKRCTQPADFVKPLVVNGNDPGFMGPLCCPLTKANIAQVIVPDKTEYWVTEKSDGIRTIFVSLLCPFFPRWKLWDGSKFCEVLFGDNVLLEKARIELLTTTERNKKESMQIRLSFGTYVMRVTEKAQVFQIVLRTQMIMEREEVQSVVRTVTPRHFSYVFDRRMDTSFLLLGEYSFAGLSSVVLDCELTMAVTQPQEPVQQQEASLKPTSRPFFAVFDLYAFSTIKNEALRPNTTFNDLFVSNGVEEFKRSPTSERLKAMQEIVFPSIGGFHQVPLFLKRLYRVEEIPELLSSLTCEASSQEGGSPSYYFHAYPFGSTRNDGMIFTPEQFDIASGSQVKQLKWKWPEALSVDWKLQPCPMHASKANPTTATSAGQQSQAQPKQSGTSRYQHIQQQQQALQSFDVHVFFKKKRADGSDDVGHSMIWKAALIKNPKRIKIPTTDGGVVTECHFDGSARKWVIDKLRDDKRDANSFTTVISVMESLAERLDLATLLDALELGSPPASCLVTKAVNLETEVKTNDEEATQRDDDEGAAKGTVATAGEEGHVEPSTAAGEEGHEASIPRPVAVSFVRPCRFALRATQEKFKNTVSLRLQYAVKLPHIKNVIPCNHRLVRECFGLGEPCPELDPTSRLEELLMIELGNAGGCQAWSELLCDAFYDAKSGRWGIVKVHSDKALNASQSLCNYTMDHLQYLAIYRATHGDKYPPFPPMLNGPMESRNTATSDMASVPTNLHYAERTKLLSHGKQQRSALRRFNNFIKSMLIETTFELLRSEKQGGEPTSQMKAAVVPTAGAATSTVSSAAHRRRQVETAEAQQPHAQWNVADFCCGRGGDLQKWKLQRISNLLMVDSCLEAVAEAASRYSVTAGLSTKVVKGRPGYPGIPSHFFVRDCFNQLSMESLLTEWRQARRMEAAALMYKRQPAEGAANRDAAEDDGQRAALEALAQTIPPQSFDLVSCQFSMHYGFNSEVRVRNFLWSVAAALRVGGFFIGTTVDDRSLLRLRNEKGSTFGNSIFEVVFPETTVVNEKENVYAQEYSISVEHSVDAASEYIVHWEPFAALAKEYHLEVVETLNFSEAAEKYTNCPTGQKLLEVLVKETGGGATGTAAADDGEGNEKKGKLGMKRTADGGWRFALDDDEREAANLFRTIVLRKSA